MPNWKKVIISGSDAALNSLNVTTSVTASNISASGDIYTDTLIFNTGSDHSVGGGQVGWNTADGTLNIGLEDGVVLQAGQELHVRAKAQGAISNGDAVMFAGAQGDHILVSTATQAVINANPEYFVGIATHNLSNNEFGYIATFGLVRELDTDTPAWDPGTVLWFDSEGVTAGALTSTQPSAPYAQIRVAAVTRRNPAEGVILVRPDRLPKLNDLQDVQHTTPDYGDLIMYNSSSEVWENTKTLSGSYTIDNGDLDVDGSITGSDVLIDDWGSVSASLAAAGGGSGTVTSVSGTGTVSGITLTGTVTTSGNLTLGGTLTLTSGQITTGLGFTPYNSTNPAGYTTNTGTVTGTGTTNYISKWTSTTAQGNSLIFDDGTNIGIGTTSPNFDFTIESTSKISNIGIGALSGNGFTPYEIGHGFGGGNISSKISFETDNPPTNFYGDAIIFSISSYTPAPTGGDSTSEVMRITNDGKLGIGTTSPDEELEVNGNIKISETAATTDTDKFVVLDSGVLKYRTGTQLLSDIGGGSGTVTSVGGTGTVSGLTLTGTVTTSGNLTLGGTISISSTNITDVDAFSQSGTYASLRAQATTKGDVGLGNVENTALSTYTGNGGALDNQYITNGAGYTTATGTVDTSGVPVANDFARFTDADTIEGRSYSEVKSDLSLNNVENTALSTYTGNGGALDNQYITNGAGYTTNTGTVTSVGGTGTVSGLTLTGTVTTSGNLTLGGTLTLTSGQITTGLGFTPYNATNPSGYTSFAEPGIFSGGGTPTLASGVTGAEIRTLIGAGSGTVTSVGGTGTVSGITLTGTVTTSGNLTLGGTLTLTSGQITTGLGFTPYNATNPAGYTTNTGTVTGTGTTNYISKWTSTSAQGNSLIFDNGTNVGIGTTSPDDKLHVNGGNLRVEGGDILLENTIISNQDNLDVDTGTETVAEISSTTYTAAFFDYVIKNGTNLRAGTVFACHDGSSNVEYTETSTNDLGDTSDVTLKVDVSGGNLRLTATTTSNNWSIKSLVRGL